MVVLIKVCLSNTKAVLKGDEPRWFPMDFGLVQIPKTQMAAYQSTFDGFERVSGYVIGFYTSS